MSAITNNSTTHDDEDRDVDQDPHTEDASKDETPAPFAPDSDDDSALGDTDEHSDA